MNNIENIGLNRSCIDKFYTKTSIAELCVEYVKQYIQITENELIIEPSAGNGSFIPYIKNITNNYKFYDLEPETDEIIRQDYLTLNIEEFVNKNHRIHIIGNPPFGRQSCIAKKFIKKSCEYCNTISLILPKSFKKDSFKKTFPLNFHLIFENDLPDKSFLVDGIEHNVPCVFQIWEKKSVNRLVIEKIEPLNFIFVNKNDNPHISVRRVGVNAGKVDKNTNDKNIQTHYFIKFIDGNLMDNNIDKIKKLNFEFNNTVGPKSISKPELISKLNELLYL